MSIVSRPPEFEQPCTEAETMNETIGHMVLLNQIGEGSFGVVYRAKDTNTGKIMAIKKVELEESSLTEMKCLAAIRHHPSIIHLKEVGIDDLQTTAYLVMEYAEKDFRSLLNSMPHPFSETQARGIMSQLLHGVRYIHCNGYLHQDLKPENLLVTQNGDLKICDFGLCRPYDGSPVPYTKTVGTLWYRAPELLLQEPEYSAAIDIWSVGCILAEILRKEPLFPGRSRKDQITEIVGILGTRMEKLSDRRKRLHQIFQQVSLSSDGVDLLARLLAFEPEERITADAALSHPWFSEVM